MSIKFFSRLPFLLVAIGLLSPAIGERRVPHAELASQEALASDEAAASLMQSTAGVGLPTGFALHCKQACRVSLNKALEESNMHEIGLAFVMYQTGNNWYKTKFCMPKGDRCILKERFSYHTHLISIPGESPGTSAPPVLTFRNQPVASLTDLMAIMKSGPELDSALQGKGGPAPPRAQAPTTNPLYQKLSSSYSHFVPLEWKLHSEAESWLEADATRRSNMHTAYGSLHLLRTLMNNMACNSKGGCDRGHSTYTCTGAGLGSVAAASSISSTLSGRRASYQDEQSENLKAIASSTYSVVMGVFAIVGDMALPGVGSAANAAHQALQAAGRTVPGAALQAVKSTTSAVQKYASAEVIGRMEKVQEGLQSIGNGIVPDSVCLTCGVDPDILEVGDAFEGGASDTVQEQLKEKLKEAATDMLHLTERKETKQETLTMVKAWKATKAIMWSAMQAGALEGAWTAATFIPVIGPYVGLARSLGDLSNAIMNAKRGHEDYLAYKDPLLRGLFRIRDCQLELFIDTPTEEDSRSPNAMDLQAAAIRTAIEAGSTSQSVNDILLEQMQLDMGMWTDEDRIMRRLNTGNVWFLTRIPTSRDDKCDAYLPEKELKPSELQRHWDTLNAEHPGLFRTILQAV